MGLLRKFIRAKNAYCGHYINGIKHYNWHSDDSSRVITYTKVDQSYVPSEYYIYGNTFVPGQEVVYSPFTGDYDFYPFEQSFGYTVEYVCQTSFLVEDGIVRAWRWKGNNCVAY